MITHTIDQFISDPKWKQDESRKIKKKCEKLKFEPNMERIHPEV